jgi:hypothetical protein
VAIVNARRFEGAAMSHQYATAPRPATMPATVPATSALLGTSLLVTRSPRHNRALNGLLRMPTGRVT